MVTSSILAQSSTTRKPPAPLGRLLAGGTCPQAGCHRASIHYSLETHAVTCAACGWTAILTPKEQQDMAFFLCYPEALPLAEFLAAIARRDGQPDPVLLFNRRQGRRRKNIAPPRAPESRWGRLMRLAEQARDANGIAVELVRADAQCTVFRAESQRSADAISPQARDAYQVVVDDRGVRCECPAGSTAAPCGHVGGVYLWCLEQQAAALPIIGAQRTREEIQARADAAINDLWGAA